MRKPFVSLIAILLLLIMFGLVIGLAGNISANSEKQKPVNYYPDRVSLIEYGGYLSVASDHDVAEIVRDYTHENSEVLGLTGTDLSGAKITDEYTSEANGVTHVYFQQLWQGLLVDDAFINANVSEDGRILTLNSSFFAELRQKANDSQPGLSAVDAVEVAAEFLGLEITKEIDVLAARGGADAGVLLSDGGISLEPIPAKLMYDPISADIVRLAWDITIYETNADHWWSMRVDANDGRILSQNDFVVHDTWSDDAALAPTQDRAIKDMAAYQGEGALLNGYKVYPMPIESPIHTSPAPPSDGRINVVDPDDSLASPYGWHDTDGAAGPEYTTTQGNNVHGYTDIDDNNLPDSGSSPDGGPSLGFDFPVVLTQPPSTYRPAAVTNLFYWNNINHDVYYHFGFDEAGGNFQENNYGRGGLGSDYVNAEAQDDGGSNNANFATPPDGSNPRMQMYIWDYYTSLEVGGSFDNGVIVHEYGHGISNRLTGGPSQASCLGNDEQMGEGWSDLSTLFLTALPSHTETTARGIGTYVLGQATTGIGIRNFRYSTDMQENPQTYDYIRSAVSEHDLGEIWAAMYWEVYWNLVDAYGFNPNVYGDWTTGGNNLAMQLYIDGMKFQPCSPGFVDGRDAILSADVALTGGLNQCLIWEGFSKRGLGFGADQGTTGSRNDGTEAFDMPPACTTIDTIPSPTTNDVCAGDSASYLVGVGVNFTAPITMDGSTDAPYSAVSFTPNPIMTALPALVEMEVSTTSSTPYGTYTIDFAGNDVGSSADGSTTLNVFDAVPGSLILSAPANAATDVVNPPTFEWAASAQAITYTLEVDDDPAFGSVDYSAVVDGTTHALPFNQPLDYLTTYYWRVTAGNICGDTVSSIWELTTVNEPGECEPGLTTKVVYETDLEGGGFGWTHSGTGDTWTLSDARTTSGVNAWYAEDLDGLSDQRLVSPQITLPPAIQSPITLKFQNYQAFEEPDADGCWDAGIVEISTDNGSSWSKVPNSALMTDPYDNFIWNESPGNNPIFYDYGVTMAWCDPEQPFLNSVVLLDDFAAQQVRFRWRLATDSYAGSEGWYIDDVKVQSCASAQEKIYLPIMEASVSTPLVQESHTEAPFLGLIVLPTLVGILPILRKRR